MIRIVDATLIDLESYQLSQEEILKFCGYMKQIGITNLELSTHTYRTLERLPEGFRWFLKLGVFDKAKDYPGVFKYIVAHENIEPDFISEFQVNDIREIFTLRQYEGLSQVRIKGLDDIITHRYEDVLKKIMEIFKGKTINICPENTYYCATAIAISWLLVGGNEVTTSFAGIGGLAATEEVYLALRVIERYKPNQSLVALTDMKEWYEKIANKKLSSKKPVIGSKIFCVESGIHVDGILKKASNYEAYAAAIVGQKTTIVIGKHSGGNSIREKCREYGIIVEKTSVIEQILLMVKQISMENKRSLSDDEFVILVKGVLANGGKEDC